MYACTFIGPPAHAAVVSVQAAGPAQADEDAALARLASDPPHAHVTAARSQHVAGGRSYTVSERLQRELFDELIDIGVMPEALACARFAQILSGLRHMHRLGVPHRDIKLENIMFTQQGVLKLLDFNLSRPLPAQPPPGPVFISQIPAGPGVGTRSYMAPEVVAGAQHDMFLADVWSLGCVLFALTTGFFFVDRAAPADAGFRRAQMAQQNGLSTVGAMYNMYNRPNPLGADLVALLDGMLCINPAERMTLDAVCSSAWASQLGAAIFAHDMPVPLAPELWRLRAQPRWARLGRPTVLANAFLRALVDQAVLRADLRPGGPGMLAAQAEFEATAPVYDLLAGGRSEEEAPVHYRSTFGFGEESPVYRGLRVTSLEELEAALSKAGVPRKEPPPLVRQKAGLA